MQNLHTVLFEEDRNSAEVTNQLLLQANVNSARHFRDIDEAFDICFRMKIDVLLVDMDNPNNSGKTLIRRLRKKASTTEFNTRILALIGTNEQEAILSAASCGVDSIIMKPIAADVVKTRLISVHKMEVNYLRFDQYYGPDRRIMPDRLPTGQTDKRSVNYEAPMDL